MADARGVTRYDVMPIPPVEGQTRYFDAGAIVIGVEYRLLDDAIAAANAPESATGSDRGDTTGIDDRGVSLHVFAVRDGERHEHLRFDCFDEDPHYHYVSWRDRTNDMVHLDRVADGDPLEWSLDRIRYRLAPMLVRAGAEDVVDGIDAARLEAVLPKVAEAAYRARFDHDAASVRRAALAGRPG